MAFANLNRAISVKIFLVVSVKRTSLTPVKMSTVTSVKSVKQVRLAPASTVTPVKKRNPRIIKFTILTLLMLVRSLKLTSAIQDGAIHYTVTRKSA